MVTKVKERVLVSMIMLSQQLRREKTISNYSFFFLLGEKHTCKHLIKLVCLRN